MTKLQVRYFTDLDEAKARYIQKTDVVAEKARERFITASPGQSMTYEAKYQEALRYPQGSGFPFLAAEAAALEVAEQQVADSVLQARQEWETVGAQIESLRLKTKKVIRTAASPADMHRAIEDMTDALSVV